ncbi:MAG: hypothetical protein ABIG08_00820 [bacterium]
MLTSERIDELYAEANYRAIVEGVDLEELNPDSPEDEKKLLQVAWSRHQLGEYDKSVPITGVLRSRWEASTEIGESARRCLAHGLLQKDGNIEGADEILRQIPSSPDRDNVRVNMFLTAARNGLEISATTVMTLISMALLDVPHRTVHGHIINNGTLALHEARQQEEARLFLPVLPGLIEVAYGIYEAAGTAKNHLAGALYRASLIFEAAGPSWLNGAEVVCQGSIALWQELWNFQGGERYEKNLNNARAQLVQIQQKKKEAGIS